MKGRAFCAPMLLRAPTVFWALTLFADEEGNGFTFFGESSKRAPLSGAWAVKLVHFMIDPPGIGQAIRCWSGSGNS
ncbi:hypothetical protein AMQ84_02435 [Paenibacillus riograndensis]|uniref:Uncharacterized protein n=1 Tax=Paenibacillus riograndensis TaxID=483937 RepID=A0A132UBQ2_9BACL|nr:hypothetical protein AMQ84_02435 [Paenibacillus riograndensis]KWX86037.1 hypothetical protein AMQ83_21290 [Paenibacillus riograndensis]